jgi:hypothetical protein
MGTSPARILITDKHLMQVVLHHGFVGLKRHRLEYASIKFPPPFDEFRLMNCSWRGLQSLINTSLSGQGDHAYLARLVRA